MNALLSRDPRARRDAYKDLLAKLRTAKGMSEEDVARIVSIAGKRWRTIMLRGTRPCPPACDVGVLSEVLGVELLDAFARALGYRVVPVERVESSPVDVLVAATGSMREHAEAVTAVTEALPGGFTPAEHARAKREIAEARRALDVLEAVVDGAVVRPPVQAVP